MIPYGKQSISEQDIDAVINVLKSDFLTQGPQVPNFENGIKANVNCKHALAVSSATAALHIACLALGVGKGDVVWTSPISFVASANCALYCGAIVDFVDIDIDTANMSIAKLTHKLKQAKRIGKLPKVVIPVHFSGQSCDMEALAELSKTYGFSIIEDASHCIGGQYKGSPIGDCRFSDICVFSFHPVKIITSAEGGIATTNNDAIALKMDLLRNNGITRNEELMTHAPDGDWYYQQILLGFNYRMTELQAALGYSQLQQLNQFVKQRNVLSHNYDEAFSQISAITPLEIKNTCFSSCHLYVIKVADKNHKALFNHLRKQKIGVNLHYIPIYKQPYFQSLNYVYDDCPNAEEYYKSAISIPLYAQLTKEQQIYIINTIKNFIC